MVAPTPVIGEEALAGAGGAPALANGEGGELVVAPTLVTGEEGERALAGALVPALAQALAGAGEASALAKILTIINIVNNI